MKLSPSTAPTEPDNLLIRLHNQVGAALDITGNGYDKASRWDCHGCADHSDAPRVDYLSRIRRDANDHAATCRAAYHRLP
ncbi:hypothetical protein ACFV30_11880 [Streptomyces sp. NPDC059752]|uniref:hypothetical protein n=1 Tax=unclassified Streptomyces TaxID=2593676 RepID=UPI003662BEC0